MKELVCYESQQLPEAQPWIIQGVLGLMQELFDIQERPYTESDLTEEIAHSEMSVILIDPELPSTAEAVRGFMLSAKDPHNRLWLNSAYVREEDRNQGHWSAMTDILTDGARAKGEPQVLAFDPPFQSRFLNDSLRKRGFTRDKFGCHILKFRG